MKNLIVMAAVAALTVASYATTTSTWSEVRTLAPISVSNQTAGIAIDWQTIMPTSNIWLTVTGDIFVKPSAKATTVGSVSTSLWTYVSTGNTLMIPVAPSAATKGTFYVKNTNAANNTIVIELKQ